VLTDRASNRFAALISAAGHGPVRRAVLEEGTNRRGALRQRKGSEGDRPSVSFG